MMDKPVIIIEHLEEEFGIWIFLEYRHASMIIGRDNIWFTNIPRRYHKMLNKYGRVYEESIVELVEKGVIPMDKLIILDPAAKKELRREEIGGSYIVVGGILGDHPPRGRTSKLLTSRLPGVRARNIGGGQYSIDGTVYYVYYFWRYGLGNYRYIDGVTIKTPGGYVKLPFRYPLVDGKPLLAPGLEYYLRYGRIPEDILREVMDLAE